MRMSFLAELKRRNVVRAGAAYVVLAWLVIQVADILFETFELPNWVMQALVIHAMGLHEAMSNTRRRPRRGDTIRPVA